jgi:hypothetical protein
MTRYGLWGVNSRDFLTYGGRVLTHESRAELEYLVPNTPVREVPPSFPAEQCLPIKLHPDLVNVQWPLTKEQFRRG